MVENVKQPLDHNPAAMEKVCLSKAKTIKRKAVDAEVKANAR